MNLHSHKAGHWVQPSVVDFRISKSTGKPRQAGFDHFDRTYSTLYCSPHFEITSFAHDGGKGIRSVLVIRDLYIVYHLSPVIRMA